MGVKREGVATYNMSGLWDSDSFYQLVGPVSSRANRFRIVHHPSEIRFAVIDVRLA